MKIGIFGGSFNPVHKSHVQIAQDVIKKLNLAKLFFVLAKKSPFKVDVKYVSTKHRLNMLKMILPLQSSISHFEIKKNSLSYSIDTINYFRAKYPQSQIYFVIGSDQLDDLHKWKDIALINKLVKFVIVKRKDCCLNLKKKISKLNSLILDSPPYGGSSSQFKKGNFHFLDSKVNKYIGENYLYLKPIMKNMMDSKRYNHSLSVGQYAKKYAKRLNVDPQKASVAGRLHDITKSWSIAKHREFLRKNKVNEKKIADFQLHSLSGYYWIKNEYMLKDSEILNAVLKHTSLSFDLSLMDKIIFAADKLCANRNYKGIIEDRKLILENFDKGFQKIVSITFQNLLKKHKLTLESQKVYQKWMNY